MWMQAMAVDVCSFLEAQICGRRVQVTDVVHIKPIFTNLPG